MKAGIGSYAFAWAIGVPGREPEERMRASDLLRVAASLGAEVVQIGDNLPLDPLTAAERGELAETAEELGIEVELGMRGLTTERVERYVGICKELRCRLLRVVVDTADWQPDDATIAGILKGCLPILRRSGITLGVENHDRFRSRSLAEILRSVGSEQVGVCLDTVNSFGALEGPAEVLRVLGPLTVNLHVKDFRIDRMGHNMGFVVSGTPAGEGMLDIRWVLGELRAHGRDVNAILEQWPAPEGSISATVQKERDWAERGFRALRAIVDSLR